MKSTLSASSRRIRSSNGRSPSRRSTRPELLRTPSLAAPRVEVDQQHPAAEPGSVGGEAGRERRAPFPRERGCHEHHPRRPVATQVHGGQHRAHRLDVGVEPAVGLPPGPIGPAVELRDGGDAGQAHGRPHLLGVADPVIKAVAQEPEDAPRHGGADEAEDREHGQARCAGAVRDGRAGQDAPARHDDRRRLFRFLRLLQEQLVEALASGGLALQLAELELGLPVAGPCPQHAVKLLLECGDPRLRGRRLALEASHDSVRLLANLGRENPPAARAPAAAAGASRRR